MRIISSDEIDYCLEDRDVLETLRRAFRSSIQTPYVDALTIPRPKQSAGALEFHPAWTNFAGQGHSDRGYIGCNLKLSLPELTGPASNIYVLFSGSGGQPIALIDGMRLGVWRKAGIHGLAAAYLAREDARRMLVIGDDPRLPRIVSAYSSVRGLTSVLFCGTAPSVQKRISGNSGLSHLHFGTTADIPAAVEGADIVCVAGPAHNQQDQSLLPDDFDPPAGCHIDVLNPRLSLPSDLLEDCRLFTSDCSHPPFDGKDWAADLTDLARGDKAGRRYYGQRTLFCANTLTGKADFALATHVFLRT
ncbi:ornithine cyclodeaminase [Roseibium denhamense]|uniref:Ornithine cyclodeaminase n=1 Tax=Roseibium denhamense TaxID=76305 RepID=A0ABY1PJL7_9HYPH|nr:ornithine cyclodeaminase [Roseibium denhamense]MTI05899.1 ornithine cyclodeaminase [Roseibium denhamense]SMP35689.1 ornithine cyclodeaminase [Roseibium denhamense]